MPSLDKTWCLNWKECKHGQGCVYALTEEVKKLAENLEIQISKCEKRECFESIDRKRE